MIEQRVTWFLFFFLANDSIGLFSERTRRPSRKLARKNRRTSQPAGSSAASTTTHIPPRFWPVSNFFFCCRAEEGKDWTECEWRDIAERRAAGHDRLGDAGTGPGPGCRGPAKAEPAEHPRRQGGSQEVDLVRQWVHTRASMRVTYRRRSEKSSAEIGACVNRNQRFLRRGVG